MSATHDLAAALAPALLALNDRGAGKALAELARHLDNLASTPLRPITAYDLLDAITFALALGMACQDPPRALVVEAVPRTEEHPPWCKCQRVCGGDG